MIRIGLRDASYGVIDDAGIAQLDDRRQRYGWWVAANDKWHDPCSSPSVRQQRIDGTPVVETKIAVPGGDVVQRAFAVADQGGALVYEFENRSADAVAIAVPARHVATTAATRGTTPQGIAPNGVDVPRDIQVFPLARTSIVRFAWPLRASRWGRRSNLEASALSTADSVVRGWVRACEQASRIPVDTLRVNAARCELLMARHREIEDVLKLDPALGVLAVGERVRMGDPAVRWVSDLADAVERIARLAQRSQAPQWTNRAFSLAASMLKAADEHDGAQDAIDAWHRVVDVRRVDSSTTATSSSRVPPTAASHIAALIQSTNDISSIEDQLVRAVAPGHAHLFADGLAARQGVNFEAHTVHAGPEHRVSLAVRWHGPNAAVLWEVEGPPGLRLTAPSVDIAFDTAVPQGEALMQLAR